MGKKKKQEKQKEKKKKLSIEEIKRSEPEKKKKKEKTAKKDKKSKKKKQEELLSVLQMDGSYEAVEEPDIAELEPEAEEAEVPADTAAVPEPVQGVISRKEATLIFRALGDETRMEIISFLEKGEMCGVELLQCVKIVQSTLSHHMRILTDAGLVSCRKDNKRIYYSICMEQMEKAAVFLNAERAIPTSNV